MRSGPTFFVGKAIFVVNFLRGSENSKILWKKKDFTPKKRKTMKDFCLRHRTTEIQKMSSWRDETNGFSAKRKINLSCSKEHD